MSTDCSIFNWFLHRKPSHRPFACAPLGPLYLCAALERASHSVDFHDYQLQTADNPHDPATVCNFLERAESTTIGISSMSNLLPFLLLGLRSFKHERSDSFVVLGGSGVSGSAGGILRAFPDVDAIVSGEGEDAIVEILEARSGRRSWNSIAGLTFRDDHSIRRTPARPRRRDLDSLPYPSYERLDLTCYFNFPVLTTRGCPHRCMFCDIGPNWQRIVTQRGIPSVIDEIEMLQQRFGARTITILDDVFVLNGTRVSEFCAGVLQRGLNIGWSCMCRVDLLNDDLMERMQRAGCRRIFLGIESGSERVRKIVGKGLRIRNVEEMIARAVTYFDVAASFIVGFPFETLDDFRETLMLIIYCYEKGAKPQMSVLSPLPQAELTCGGIYEKEFDPDLISGMAFPSYRGRASSLLASVLTPEVQQLIRSEPAIFSAFYHFPQGRVREKLELCAKFGLKV